MRGSTGLILEKLLDDRMGKSSAKVHRRDLEKIKKMMSDSRTLIKTASFASYTTGGILRKDIKSESVTKHDYFFFYYILRTGDLPKVVKYIPDGNMFMLGVDLSKANILNDRNSVNIYMIRDSFRTILADINRKYLQLCASNLGKGLNQKDYDMLGRSVLQDYFTMDGMKLIDSIYSNESDFLDSLDSNGTLSKVSSNGVPRHEFFKLVYEKVVEFVENSHVGLKFRDGYFKFTESIPNVFPMYLINFDEDKFITNRIFQKTYGADTLLKRMKGKHYDKNLVCSIEEVLSGKYMMGMSFEGIDFDSSEFFLDNKNISMSQFA